MQFSTSLILFATIVTSISYTIPVFAIPHGSPGSRSSTSSSIILDTRSKGTCNFSQVHPHSKVSQTNLIKRARRKPTDPSQKPTDQATLGWFAHNALHSNQIKYLVPATYSRLMQQVETSLREGTQRPKEPGAREMVHIVRYLNTLPQDDPRRVRMVEGPGAWIMSESESEGKRVFKSSW
ncbi:hypothetical protein BC835DRAFT_1356056 [Cytidiella melzeri]|nr:hypothetical protein BC835DRAFT_1356056 [Cytidiella melzeri]